MMVVLFNSDSSFRGHVRGGKWFVQASSKQHLHRHVQVLPGSFYYVQTLLQWQPPFLRKFVMGSVFWSSYLRFMDRKGMTRVFEILFFIIHLGSASLDVPMYQVIPLHCVQAGVRHCLHQHYCVLSVCFQFLVLFVSFTCWEALKQP